MAKKKETTKRPVGRPSKYKPEYCDKIIEYCKSHKLTERQVVKRTIKDDGSIDEVEEIRPLPPPTMFGFAASIGVCDDTLNQWTKDHPEFSAAVRQAKQIMANHVVSNAMAGNAPNSFAIFMMKNISNWVDKTESKVDATVKTYENLLDETFKDE